MTILTMCCRQGMRALPSNSLSSMVTDPPYGLSKQPKIKEVLRRWLAGEDYAATGGGFMGKSWDSFVPGPLTWKEAHRVLKPGAYVAVFAGSRTVDLMSISLRLAGFEIVDMCHWFYGSGFPKSLDIGKAVDARDKLGPKLEKQYKFTNWFRSASSLSSRGVDLILDANGMGRHYRDVLPGGKQPEVPTREHFELLRPHIGCAVPVWVELLIEERTTESENLKRRRVVGEHQGAAQAATWRAKYAGSKESGVGLITEAYSDEAKMWDGWGTALKPAHEPIIIARKPLDGTYANNVMAHGVGALNIDGCRTEGGRWPGNVWHDGCLPDPMDKYFYSAKASKADREAGLELFEWYSAGDVTGGRTEGSAALNSPRSGAGRTSGAKNIHPTVKPTELMLWLCRLVTPPGGTILDPFAGTGSTGRGAALEGFEFIGFEIYDQYAQIARARIAEAKR